MEGLAGSMTIDQIAAVWKSWLFTMVQVVPLSVERKTSPLVPTYKVAGVTGLTAREKTYRSPQLARPVFTAVQVVPLFVERNTPPHWVPAYSCLLYTSPSPRD